jgi:hypothetical protein
MKKYDVWMSLERDYSVEAENEEEAKRIALEQFNECEPQYYEVTLAEDDD